MFRSNDMSIPTRPPAVTRAMSPSSSMPSKINTMWLRTARWTVAMAKRVYPVVLMFAIIVTVVVATIALRLAIWLPTFRH